MLRIKFKQGRIYCFLNKHFNSEGYSKINQYKRIFSFSERFFYGETNNDVINTVKLDITHPVGTQNWNSPFYKARYV